MQVRVFGALDDLPAGYRDLLAKAGSRNFYLGLPWFRNLIETASDSGDTVRLYGVERTDESSRPVALFVARALGPRDGPLPPRTLAGFTALYSTEFDLVVDPGWTDMARLAKTLADAFARERPRWDAIEIKALDPTTPFFDAMVAALRRSGFAVQPYFHFGSWYESTEGMSFEAYLRQLPKGLRQLRKKLQAPNGPVYRLIGEADLEWAIAEYERLYRSSWKEPEPYPHFTAGLARAAARAGCLRFGVLSLADQPIAAQIWIVIGGRATIFKVVHDERHKRLSPGSILTLCLMDHVLGVDRVREVDFGRGDDGYKKMWLPKRREFWAINAFNPLTLRGAAGALRHVGLTRAARLARAWTGKGPAPLHHAKA